MKTYNVSIQIGAQNMKETKTDVFESLRQLNSTEKIELFYFVFGWLEDNPKFIESVKNGRDTLLARRIRKALRKA